MTQHDVLFEKVGKALEGICGPERYRPIQGAGGSGYEVMSPDRPDQNQSTTGTVLLVPADPAPEPYVKVVAPVLVDFALTPETNRPTFELVNNTNNRLLSSHLVIVTAGDGRNRIDMVGGMPCRSGEVDSEQLGFLLSDVIGVADVLDDQFVERLGFGQTLAHFSEGRSPYRQAD